MVSSNETIIMQKRSNPRPEAYTDRSPQGFANKYGFSLSHVYNLMRSGELPALKSRGRTIITEQNEDTWLDSLEPFIPAANRTAA